MERSDSEERQDAITDVPGVRVGQVQRRGDGWLTGVTVVVPPPGTVGGVDVRGGGPGTHETDALDPRTLVQTVDAVVLTGGSAYGLVTAHGVQRWCAEQGLGFEVGPNPGEVVPIVPAAAVFDLGRGGVFINHPTEQMGYEAAAAASGGAVARGVVGAGTGAVVGASRPGGGYKGGVGTASIRLPAPNDDVVVGALAVVNAAGLPLPGLETSAGPLPERDLAPDRGTSAASDGPQLNTTIAVVATNADLDPAETSRTATAAHAGLARALDPVHTLTDGDTVFTLATGAVPLHGTDRRSRVVDLTDLQRAAAEVLRRAVLDGVAAAEDVQTPAGPIRRFPAPRVGASRPGRQDRDMGRWS